MGKQLGVAPRTSALLAAGTSICGVTAITALSPAIRATKQETAVAVANVVVFGTCGMLMWPYLAHSMFPTSQEIGMFLGTAVHDTSQVMGSALTYQGVYGDDVVVQTAAVTKLTRNMFLAGVIPGLTWWQLRAASQPSVSEDAGGVGTGGEAGSEGRPPFPQNDGKVDPKAPKLGWQDVVPLFVLGFVGMSGVRTLGDYTLVTGGDAFGLMDKTQWKTVTSAMGDTFGSQMCMGTAMAAVGLGIKKDVFKGVGWRPFALGLSGSLVVSGTGLSMILLTSKFA